MQMERPWGPDLPLYTWDVEPPDPESPAAVSGVTSDRSVAIMNLHLAMQDAPPGSQGRVRRVALAVGKVKYVYLSEIANARRDETTPGGVTWGG